MRRLAKLYFYYASMNAGKSSNLLQAAFNYGERDMRVSLWTAAIDDQTGKETWVNDATGEVLKAGGAAADDRSVGSKGSTGKKGPRARRRIKSKGG